MPGFGSIRHGLSSVQPQMRQTPLMFFGIVESLLKNLGEHITMRSAGLAVEAQRDRRECSPTVYKSRKEWGALVC